MTTVEQARIPWRSWVWIAWRQHSKSIIVATAITAVALLFITPVAGTVFGDLATITSGIWAYTPTILSVLVALFWAAPLIAREYEDRTVVFSWTQDVSRTRWAAGRSVPPLVIAVVLIAVLNFVLRSQFMPDKFTTGLYEANPYLHTTYVVFGFVVGLTFSAWLRQTPGAIGGTLTAFVGFRVLMATSVRPYLVEPKRSVGGYGQDIPGMEPSRPPGAYIVESGYLGLNGKPVSVPSMDTQQCLNTSNQVDCFRRFGIDTYYVEYQPVSAMWKIQVLEGCIYLACTGLLLLFLKKVLDKRQRI